MQDEEEDEICMTCGDGGDSKNLLLCDGKTKNGKQCPNAQHTYCCEKPLAKIPVGDWFCDPCKEKNSKTKRNSKSSKKQSEQESQEDEEQEEQEEESKNQSEMESQEVEEQEIPKRPQTKILPVKKPIKKQVAKKIFKRGVKNVIKQEISEEENEENSAASEKSAHSEEKNEKSEEDSEEESEQKIIFPPKKNSLSNNKKNSNNSNNSKNKKRKIDWKQKLQENLEKEASPVKSDIFSAFANVHENDNKDLKVFDPEENKNKFISALRKDPPPPPLSNFWTGKIVLQNESLGTVSLMCDKTTQYSIFIFSF